MVLNIKTATRKVSHKLDMTTGQIAEKLGTKEYLKLCFKVEDKYHQKFGVIKIDRDNGGATVTIETQDGVRHILYV